MTRPLRWLLVVGAALGAVGAGAARADEPGGGSVAVLRSTATEPGLDDAAILGRAEPFRVQSVRVSTMFVQQDGHGYQSAATPAPQDPGSEEVVVIEPQLQVVAAQGAHVTHELWVPIDVVAAASPDAIDVTTNASRVTESGSIDLTSTWEATPDTRLKLSPVFHMEEPIRGYGMGLGVERSLAGDNAVVAASVHEMLDWIDRFELDGKRRDRGTRSTLNASASFTQLLSPTTVVGVNYGLTVQVGELGNGWNSLPVYEGLRGLELVPEVRTRHALVGRVAQWLPWNGALTGSYRLYLDDWGIVAHSAEAQLHQRLGSWLTLRANLRVHGQTAADFYTERARSTQGRRTADSDLAALHATTVGLRASVDLGAWQADLGLERYTRSNDLHANILTCSFGTRFY